MRFIREILIVVISFVALLYLFAPSLIPDLLPVVGWIDEGIATTIVLSALRHYGLDLAGLFGSSYVRSDRSQQAAAPAETTSQVQTIRISRAELERLLQEAEQRDLRS